MSEKRDWNKLIEQSNGQLVRCPEAFIPRVKEWLQKRAEFNAVVEKLAKEEVLFNQMFQTLIVDARKYLDEELGIKKVWSADVGIEMGAVADGEYILNVIDPVGK